MPTFVYGCGFEAGHLKNEPTIGNGVALLSPGGSATLETTIVRTGSGSLKVVVTSGANSYLLLEGVTYNTHYTRFYIRVTSRPATTARHIFGRSGTNHFNIALNPDGTLTMSNNLTAKGTSATALTDTSRWYRIEIKVTNGSQELKIDGVSEVTSSDATAINYCQLGTNDAAADAYTVYYDDLCICTGGYPGAGQSVLLVPISDNARASLWTGGAGGTTSLFEAVNNKPPIGTATETDLTQIEHAGDGAAGDAYAANFETYASKGIASGDVINGVLPYYMSGEDVATGTKYLAGQLTSNPSASASANIDVLPASGALGTWSTNWRACTCPVASYPSVTVGNSPVFQVTRPVNLEARVASVCFMGLYVDYTPSSGTIREEAQAYYRQLAN